MSKAAEALSWAETKIGANYSQQERWGSNSFDCSSFIYRAFRAVDVHLVNKDTGVDVTTSTSEVYAKGFELLYPSSYSIVGKSLPSPSTLLSSLGLREGDLIFYSYGKTNRPNKITHVSMYAGNGRVIHARNPQTGVRFDPYTYMNTRVCAVTRFVDVGRWSLTDGQWYYSINGIHVTGWQELDWSGGRDWFLFDSEGRMLNSWQNVNGKWYYMDLLTGAMQTGWIQHNEHDYYLKQTGAMASNSAVLSPDGSKVWLLGEDGIMQPEALPIVK